MPVKVKGLNQEKKISKTVKTKTTLFWQFPPLTLSGKIQILTYKINDDTFEDTCIRKIKSFLLDDIALWGKMFHRIMIN